MTMRVIGTAGHVDHGKSTLVEALTGTHPDRLKEEREREMTIDLGFAYITLPNGEEIGIVDVPGHRDFIENMLAGIGGIDAALFVVAADEGVMLQTKEHLAILDLLQIKGGVVALTKIDLVNEVDFIDLVEDDLRQVLKDTVLDNAPIVRVSARKRIGLDLLLDALRLCLAEHNAPIDLGKPRLPVDRVFSIAGFGTVVTGTLMDGSLAVDDEIVILPQGLHSRIRGLQNHKRKTKRVLPGSRTAVNLIGVNVSQIERGNILSLSGLYQPTQRLDVQIRLLNEISHPLNHDNQIKFFLGAAEIIGRVRLIGKEKLGAGEEGWLQIELSQPVVAVRGDRFIIRRPSPSETLGGGLVLDPHPKTRYKRFSPTVIERLEALTEGESTDVLFQAIASLGSGTLAQAAALSHLDADDAYISLQSLYEDGRVFVVDGRLQNMQKDTPIMTRAAWDNLCQEAIQVLRNYHSTYPLRNGMSREELKGRIKLSSRLFNRLLIYLTESGITFEKGAVVRLIEHEVIFSPEQKSQLNVLWRKFHAAPYAPPTIKECQIQLGDDLYNAVISLGELVAVSSEVVFRQADYETARARVSKFIQKEGSITVAQARDLFDTSRRYVLALLEHFDQIGFTVRQGDLRRLRPQK